MSDARLPDALVLVNGQPLAGVLEIGISSNNHLAANRFRLTAALSASGFGFWAADLLTIEIRVGLAGAWASLIMGDVDRIEFNIGHGTVHVDGRDFTSRLIEARTQESFENSTASDVATMLAARHGLLPAVVPTTAIIGRNYDSSQSQITLDQYSRCTTEWDLLIDLAENATFDVWVDGAVLNFAPPDEAANTLTVTPADCLSVRLNKQAGLTGGLQVTVKSWDCRGQTAVVRTASTMLMSGPPRTYSVVRPNLNDTAALALAQRLLVQLSQHGKTISMEMPGDLTTKPRDLLLLGNTGSDFDGVWTVTDIERHVSFERGFVQTIEARLPAWTVF